MIQVWYHRNCTDGFCCAWIANKFFQQEGKIVEFSSLSYDEKIPIFCQEDEIYILDFSFREPILTSIRNTVKKLVVIDHHITTPNLSWIIHDNDHAASYLCWKYFFPDTKMPTLIKYVEDHDLYRFRLNFSKIILHVIKSTPFTFIAWNKLASREIDTGTILQEGHAIENYRQKMIGEILQTSHTIYLEDGKEYLAVNNNCGLLTSELGHRLAKISDPGVVYSFRRDNKVLFSLRSIEVDVAELAKKFGGGGHKHAAGFIGTLDTFYHKIGAPTA